jgi:hypothetical protein
MFFIHPFTFLVAYFSIFHIWLPCSFFKPCAESVLPLLNSSSTFLFHSKHLLSFSWNFYRPLRCSLSPILWVWTNILFINLFLLLQNFTSISVFLSYIRSYGFVLCVIIGLHLYASGSSAFYLLCFRLFAYLILASVYPYGQCNVSDTNFVTNWRG